jgi:4-amino-4-deoxy-L-arabinose transferase-like glycosyltransferase
MRPAASRRWLPLVLAVALALRLALVFAWGDRPLVSDEIGYDDIASNLVAGHGYSLDTANGGWRPTAMRGPSYVLFLAAIYGVAGHHVRAALVVQSLMDVVTCWLVWRLARRWFASDRTALLTAAIYAVYPPLVLQCAQVLSEPFIGFTIALSVTAWFAYLDRRRAPDLVLTGLALAACALSKPHLGPLTFVFAFAALPVLGARPALRSAVVLTAIVGLCFVPWMARNSAVFHAFIPGVTQGGVSFWGGTAPAGGRFAGAFTDPWVPDSVRAIVAPMSEPEASSYFFREGARLIAADPARYAYSTVRKFFQLWFNLGFDDPPSKASLALAFVHLVAFALAFAGFRRGGADPVATRLVVAMGLFWTVMHVAFCSVVRYAVPYLPLLFAFTAAGLLSWLPRAREPGGHETGGATP